MTREDHPVGFTLRDDGRFLNFEGSLTNTTAVEVMYRISGGEKNESAHVTGWWFFATPLKNMISSVGMVGNPTIFFQK